jgi:hypothetical protein
MSPGQLSLGQQQRLSLAWALALNCCCSTSGSCRWMRHWPRR